MNQMECLICQTRKNARSMAPPCDCTFVTCIECVEAFGKPSCASCGKDWPRESQMAKKFSSIFLKAQQDAFWASEQSQFVKAQPWVDWTIQCEAIRKQFRFGIRQALPPKPGTDLSTSETIFFSCPVNDCLGFITETHVHSDSRCPLCKIRVCLRCHEKFAEGHTCDEKIVENLQAIQNECKTCPICKAQVFKTSGCDHMFCTQCRHHFDWKTSRPLRQSTNGHQNSTEAWSKADFSKKRILTCVEQEQADLKSDSVPQSMMQTRQWNPTLEKFYRLTETLRYLYKSKFERLAIKYAEDLMNLRVKYLRKEMSQDQFLQRGLKLNQAHQQNGINQELVVLSLRVLNDLLWMAYQNSESEASLQDQQNTLVDFCKGAPSTLKVSFEFLLLL